MASRPLRKGGLSIERSLGGWATKINIVCCRRSNGTDVTRKSARCSGGQGVDNQDLFKFETEATMRQPPKGQESVL